MTDPDDDETLANLKVGKGIRFERIRRITGYLVGTLDRFNNAKRAEERERVKHGGLGMGRARDDGSFTGK